MMTGNSSRKRYCSDVSKTKAKQRSMLLVCVLLCTMLPTAFAESSSSNSLDDEPFKFLTNLKEMLSRNSVDFYEFFARSFRRDQGYKILDCDYDDPVRVKFCPPVPDPRSVQRLKKNRAQARELALPMKCLDDPEDPDCHRLLMQDKKAKSTMYTRYVSVPGETPLATMEPTRDDCYGNMLDGRFCTSEMPSVSEEPTKNTGPEEDVPSAPLGGPPTTEERKEPQPYNNYGRVVRNPTNIKKAPSLSPSRPSPTFNTTVEISPRPSPAPPSEYGGGAPASIDRYTPTTQPAAKPTLHFTAPAHVVRGPSYEGEGPGRVTRLTSPPVNDSFQETAEVTRSPTVSPGSPSDGPAAGVPSNSPTPTTPDPTVRPGSPSQAPTSATPTSHQGFYTPPKDPTTASHGTASRPPSIPGTTVPAGSPSASQMTTAPSPMIPSTVGPTVSPGGPSIGPTTTQPSYEGTNIGTVIRPPSTPGPTVSQGSPSASPTTPGPTKLKPSIAGPTEAPGSPFVGPTTVKPSYGGTNLGTFTRPPSTPGVITGASQKRPTMTTGPSQQMLPTVFPSTFPSSRFEKPVTFDKPTLLPSPLPSDTLTELPSSIGQPFVAPVVVDRPTASSQPTLIGYTNENTASVIFLSQVPSQSTLNFPSDSGHLFDVSVAVGKPISSLEPAPMGPITKNPTSLHRPPQFQTAQPSDKGQPFGVPVVVGRPSVVSSTFVPSMLPSTISLTTKATEASLSPTSLAPITDVPTSSTPTHTEKPTVMPTVSSSRVFPGPPRPVATEEPSKKPTCPQFPLGSSRSPIYETEASPTSGPTLSPTCPSAEIEVDIPTVVTPSAPTSAYAAEPKPQFLIEPTVAYPLEPALQPRIDQSFSLKHQPTIAYQIEPATPTQSPTVLVQDSSSKTPTCMSIGAEGLKVPCPIDNPPTLIFPQGSETKAPTCVESGVTVPCYTKASLDVVPPYHETKAPTCMANTVTVPCPVQETLGTSPVESKAPSCVENSISVPCPTQELKIPERHRLLSETLDSDLRSAKDSDCINSFPFVDIDFEYEGSEAKWRNGKARENLNFTRFLGGFEEYYGIVSRAFDVPAAADGILAKSVTMKFILYVIDDWGPTSNFVVIVGNTEVDLGLFINSPTNNKTSMDYQEGTTHGILWWQSVILSGDDFGFGPGWDKKHLVELIIPRDYFEAGSLSLEFHANTATGSAIAGIDDFVLEGNYDCLSAKKGSESAGGARATLSDVDYGDDILAVPQCASSEFPCNQSLQGNEVKKDGIACVCHFSKRHGYETLCLHEKDTHVIQFYVHDYCGPCSIGT